MLIVGEAGTVDTTLANRLTAAGHRVAVHPTVTAQRVHQAERDLGGLDAIVIGSAAGPDEDDSAGAAGASGVPAHATARPATWSTALAHAIATAANASHAAARAFLASRRAGQIILLAGRSRVSTGSTLPGSVLTAALQALGAGLAEQLRPHDISVSVVTTGPASARDASPPRAVQLVETLLSTDPAGVTLRTL